MSFSGGCLCGAVRYEVMAEPAIAGHCHCDDCRRTSGTGHGSHLGVPEESFSVNGEITFFEKTADSGNLVSRGFCPTCGSAIYSRNSGMPGLAFIRASSLDDPTVFKPQMVVYANRAAPWDVMDASLPAFDDMPPAQ